MLGAGMDVKLCECGCGEPAPIAKKTDLKKKTVRGQPVRFIARHFFRTNKGRSHANWRGGTSSKGGYVGILREDGSYILEHVKIAESVLGKKLPDGAVVHHVNGVRSDNKHCNLVICQDQAFHMLIHQRARALAATGNASSVKCGFCKQWGMPGDENLNIDRTWAAYHRSCNATYEKARRMKKTEVLL